MEEAVTFDTIREAYRRERGADRIQQLEADFYEKVLEYLSRKKGELESSMPPLLQQPLIPKMLQQLVE